MNCGVYVHYECINNELYSFRGHRDTFGINNKVQWLIYNHWYGNVISNNKHVKCVLASTDDAKVPFGIDVFRTIGQTISKDSSCILKSKMAAGGHLRKHNRFIC